MRILVVFAHPLETSFVSALHTRVVEILRAGGHIVDDLDLYAEKFDPVMSREGLLRYVDINANTREVEAYVQRLRAAEALVLVFPVWFDGLPAIMQGYFQRVFLPGVSVLIDEVRTVPSQSTAISSAWPRCAPTAKASATSRRKAIRRGVSCATTFARSIDPKGRFEYLALYNMDFNAASRRAAFMKRVTRAFESW